jgi:hypothetical protein
MTQTRKRMLMIIVIDIIFKRTFDPVVLIEKTV